MSEQEEEWRKQAFVDLLTIWDLQEQLEDIAARIEQARDENDYELYQQAISEFTGEEIES